MDSLPLKLDAQREGNTYVIRLGGELDLVSASLLETELLRGEASRTNEILIDLDGLAYIDSSGLRVLLKAKRRADSGRFRLRITRGTGHVADMLRLTAMDRTLPMID